MLQTSAYLYSQAVSPPQIAAVLGSLTVLNWLAFDRTQQGIALAMLWAVTAPTSELALNAIFGLWHYPRADVLGMVPWCDTHLARKHHRAWCGRMCLSKLEVDQACRLLTPHCMLYRVPFCYAFYTPAVSNLARVLWKQFADGSIPKQANT